MEVSNIFGIPAHPLIVHAVVVLVPLAALGAIAVVVSPTLRARRYVTGALRGCCPAAFVP